MITLPRSPLGYFLMVVALLHVAVVPFVIMYYMLSDVGAPWWVKVPLSSSASLFTLCVLVKFRSDS